MNTNPKFIFDVDGTLTPSRQKIDPNFEEWFTEFCISNDVYLVTGSDYAKTQEQLGDRLLQWPLFVFNCSGNEVWAKGELQSKREWTPPQELYNLLQGWLESSKFSIRTGKHFEERTGMINFSIVGRNASIDERKIYVDWDTSNRERESIAFQINSQFEDITATVGGETGIDIHPTNWDKSQILEHFSLKEGGPVYFFGDRTEPGGNDYPLARKINHTKQVKNWRDTWEYLEYLQEAKRAA